MSEVSSAPAPEGLSPTDRERSSENMAAHGSILFLILEPLAIDATMSHNSGMPSYPSTSRSALMNTRAPMPIRSSGKS
jgi:hypothetical protein